MFHVTPRLSLAGELAELAATLGLRARSESRFRGYAVYALVERPAA
jgi:S-adenosylmethionine-diacylgycerolhomoserine-N-methlytransferase